MLLASAGAVLPTAALATPRTTVQLSAASGVLPQGVSYWASNVGTKGATKASFILAIRINGTTIQIANPLSPCQTGVKVGTSKYRVTGLNQNGGVTTETINLKKAGPETIKTNWGVKYTRVSRKRASKGVNGAGAGQLLSHC